MLRWHVKRDWGHTPLHVEFVREKTKQVYESFAVRKPSMRSRNTLICERDAAKNCGVMRCPYSPRSGPV